MHPAANTCFMVAMCLAQAEVVQTVVTVEVMAADGGVTSSRYCQETPDQASDVCPIPCSDKEGFYRLSDGRCSASVKKSSNTNLDGATIDVTSCGAVALEMVMPAYTGKYEYHFTIINLGAHSNFGVIQKLHYDSFNYGAWPWGEAGIYTWCHCADRWDHSLSGFHNNGNSLCKYNGNVGVGLNAEAVVVYDTDTFGWTFQIGAGTGCDAMSEDAPLKWPEGTDAHFEWGGCPTTNTNKIELSKIVFPDGSEVKVDAVHETGSLAVE